MRKVVLSVVSIALLSGCTSVNVQPLQSGIKPEKICIEENPKVIVSDFLSVVRDRIEYHGIGTEVFTKTVPQNCSYIMTYTALKTWDIGMYMHHAELRLRKGNKTVAQAEYHLNGKGGLSLMKFQGTKTKMDPVVDQLLGN